LDSNSVLFPISARVLIRNHLCSSVAVLYAARIIEADAMHADDKPDPQEAAASEPAEADVAPWEELEPGRFMPRRVRGSCRGLALG
jgi:hypothetical protein